MPVVRRLGLYTCQEEQDIQNYRAFGEIAGRLAVGAVVDYPETMAHITHQVRENWGVDEDAIRETALDNLREISSPVKFSCDSNGLYCSEHHDDYEPSRILLPELFESLRLNDDPVVLIPNRRTLLVAGASNSKAIAAMAEYGFAALRQPRRVSGIPFRLRNGEWEEHSIDADEIVSTLFQAMHTITMSDEYEDQTRVLKGLDTDVFVARFMVFDQSSPSRMKRKCSLVENLPSLVSKTDFVAVTIDADSDRSTPKENVMPSADGPIEVIPIRWEDAVKIFGDGLEQLDMYPPRFIATMTFTDGMLDRARAVSVLEDLRIPHD